MAGQTVLVTRPSLEVSAFVLAPAEYAFLTSLKSDVSMDEAIAVAKIVENDFDPVACLKINTSRGLIMKKEG